MPPPVSSLHADALTPLGVFRLIEPDEVVLFSLPDESITIQKQSGQLVECMPTRLPAASSLPSRNRGRSRVPGGWITWLEWAYEEDEPLTLFSATWVVPEPPETRANQRVYLFNCLQDDGNNRLLQPVLEWSDLAETGGPAWTVSSWYITSEPALDPTFHFMTNFSQVNVGDRITGVLSAAPTGAGSVDYVCEFAGIPDSRLAIKSVAALPTARIALEAYRIGQGVCDEFPDTSTIPFTSIDLRAGAKAPPPVWTIQHASPRSCFSSRVVNPGNPGGAIDVFRFG